MSRFCMTLGWDDAVHLSDSQKKEMLAALPPHQRDARSKGTPQLGSGAIYPIEESTFVIDDMEIPPHWPRFFGMDVGWNKTAAVFCAWNREADCVYAYAEHYRGQAEPALHAQGIKAKGEWIPGVIDPASAGRGQADGIQILELYKAAGLNLETAQNGVESGIYEVWQRLSSGLLKVFKSLVNLRSEFRLYRRDDRGRVVKENDHALDALRYGLVSGLARATVKPVPKTNAPRFSSGGGSNWMG